MDLQIGLLIGAGLFVLLLVPVPLLPDQTRKSPRSHVVHLVETSRAQRHRTGYWVNTDRS